MGVPIPFGLPHPNACQNDGGNLPCPLKVGGPYKYEVTLPVEKKYPRVTVDVKWEMQNENGIDIICTLIPAKIQ